MERDPIGAPTIRRGGIVLIIVGLLFSLLLLRILLLQTVDFERYQQQVIDQLTTTVTIPAERGTIYDRNGKVLATNVTTYTVSIAPSIIQAQQKELDKKLSDKKTCSGQRYLSDSGRG